MKRFKSIGRAVAVGPRDETGMASEYDFIPYKDAPRKSPQRDKDVHALLITLPPELRAAFPSARAVVSALRSTLHAKKRAEKRQA